MANKMRYHVSLGESSAEPLRGGAICSVGYLDVEDQGSLVATDRAAYLLATNEPGELSELRRMNPSSFVWRPGMPVPGERITADMVGMTFADAISKTMKGERSCRR